MKTILIEKLIDQLHETKDAVIVSKLNDMGVSVTFLEEGIRWKII